MSTLASRALLQVCDELNVSAVVIFSRDCGLGGRALRRQPEMVEARAKVWAAMRAWRGPGGLRLSYPEIGAACGCAHSTVISGLQAAGLFTPEHESVRPGVTPSAPR